MKVNERAEKLPSARSFIIKQMHRRLLQLTRDTRTSLTLTILSGFLAGLLTIWQAWLLSSVVNNVFMQGQTLAQVMGFCNSC